MIHARTLSVGVIGAGGMGTRHAVNVHRHIGGARLVAIHDVDPARAHQAADLCGDAQVLDDPLGLIHSAEVDAVIIAAPDSTHVEFVLECLRCGKPVLCEKPLATNAQDAMEIIAMETSLSRRLVSVGFMRRFDPQHVAVRNVVQSEEIGRPILYKGIHRNAAIPYDVAGEVILTNSAGHDIDAARWLLGQEVEEVFVRGVRSRQTFSEQTRDLLLLQMALSNDCLATVEVFVAAEYGYEVSAEIVGERGVASTMQPDYAMVRAKRKRALPVPLEWLERFQSAYVAEVSDWVHSIQAGQVFHGASAWDGYQTLLITDACIRSLHSRVPEPVDLPDRPALYH